jgi:hypothetical protein
MQAKLVCGTYWRVDQQAHFIEHHHNHALHSLLAGIQ